MTRTVEVRPQAERDLDRFETFLMKMSYLAAQRRIRWLRAEIATLADNPYRGQSQDRQRYVLVLRYARTAYVVRYRLTSAKVIVISIRHGKENRPR